MQPPFLGNPLALGAIFLIVPIILLYLLKPKPKKIRFPTIMFITRMEKDRRFRPFPKRFIQDPLLIIQILAIAVMVLALASPIMVTEAEKRPEGNIVLVIDASASMQATDVLPTRFDKAKEAAKKIVDDAASGSVFNIVLAENIPAVALRKGNKENSKTVLERLECVDTTTNLGDAIMFAKDMLSTEEGNKEIYVFSDFSSTQGLDVEVAKAIAEKSGIKTKLVKIMGASRNVAVTDIDAKRFLTNRNRFYVTASIQNYNPVETRVSVRILVDGEQIEEIDEIIPANGTKLIHVEDKLSAESHLITVKIDSLDNLMLDNVAYAMIPEIRKYNVLLITDEKSDTYLQYALMSSPDIKLTKAVSPVVPEITGYDTIIHGSIPKNLLLKGMYESIRNHLQQGGNLIVLASEDLGNIEEKELREMLPVKIEWIKNIEAKISAREHEILEDTAIENIVATKYYKAELKNGAESFAEVGGMPAIAYWPYENGKVLYVGINPNPEWSNFYYSSSMPIFWFQTIKWINQEESSITQYNQKTGTYMPTKKPITVVTPSLNKITSANIIFTKAGVYTIEGEKVEKIAVNLVDEKESNIGYSLPIETIAKTDANKEKAEVLVDLYPYLLAVAVILLLIELIYYRKRGYFQK